MNAAQFATAVNSLEMPTGSASLANFLLASSTNSGVAAPDFKTIAASFFATPAATTPTGQPVPPASPATTKSTGATKLQERETNKNNGAKGSELLSPFFLPIIPAHLLNIVPSQYQVVSNPQVSEFPKQSEAPTGTPIPTNTVSAASTLQFGRQSIPVEPQVLPIGQNPSSSHDQPISAADSKPNAFSEFLSPRVDHEHRQQITQAPDTPPQPKDANADQLSGTREELAPSLPNETVSAPQQSLAITEQVPGTIWPNKTQGAAAIIQTPETSAAQAESIVPIAARFSANPEVSKISARPTNFTSDRPAPKAATSTTQKEIIERNLIPPAPRAEKNPVLNTSPRLDSAIEPAPLKKDLTLKQDHRPENSTFTQAASTAETDPVSQSPVVVPQPVAGLVKSASVETMVLGTEIPEKVASSDPGTNLISAHPAQSGSSAQGATQTEPQVVQADTSTTALKNDTATRPTVPASAAVVAPNVKSAPTKSRAEAASKSKVQGVNADTNEDGPNSINQTHQPDEHSVSPLQNTTDAGTNKNHDTAAPVAKAAPHTKLDATQNAPEAPANATQHPDIDDATPATHTSINAAKLVQGLSQSELRVGIQTRDFGNIDIRTSVSRHEFSAQISVEHGDVARTLTTELPDLYARLNEQQVSVSSIHIHNQSLSTSSGLDQRSQQSSQQQAQSSGFAKQQLEPTLPAIQDALSPTDRLDIRI